VTNRAAPALEHAAAGRLTTKQESGPADEMVAAGPQRFTHCRREQGTKAPFIEQIACARNETVLPQV
jgi:hypothetical protein